MKRNLGILLVILLFCISIFSLPSPALAGEPTNLVKQTVDKVLEVLRDKEMKKPEKTGERRAKIRKLVSERFDFAEMAKRSLAQNWKKRTPAHTGQTRGPPSTIQEWAGPAANSCLTLDKEDIMKTLILSTALCLLTSAAFARINVVTLPGRDTAQLTIYNSADLTLAKETRVLTFRKGLNRLEFSWANTLIDPTSVEFRAVIKKAGITAGLGNIQRSSQFIHRRRQIPLPVLEQGLRNREFSHSKKQSVFLCRL